MRLSYEELLARDGFLLRQTKGASMEPMLRQGREESLIKAPHRQLRKYDVVLFKGPKDRYILHRVIGREGDLYRIRGDNCMGTDLVSEDRIIGILAGFYRGDTYVDCFTDRAYLRYSRRVVATFPLRRAKVRLRSLCKAALGKLHIKE